MNRTTRTLIVVAIAIGVASVATYLVFSALRNRPTVQVEVAQAFAVVAAKPLPVGTRLKAEDVKVVAWPAANPVPGGFAKVEEVIDRGVVSMIAVNEPLNGNNVAPLGAGAGLPSMIPPGMRAISIPVNEVVGVAGFVVPSTHVDVMVVIPDGNDRLARVVVNNVQVLTAGTRYDQDTADGKPIPTSVVTLLVLPEDAEKIALAALQGQILLTLRNPTDSEPTKSRGVRTASLRSDAPPAPPPSATPTVRRPAAPPPPPPAPVVEKPKVYTIETIRGATRTQESVK